MKALSPAKVTQVRPDEATGDCDVIVPDYQLSLAIGKEGQNARLASRLTGWGINIKSETQLAEEEAYGDVDWAEGEWVSDAETGEQVWQPADGGDAVSAEAWAEAVDENVESDSESEGEPAAEAESEGKPAAEAGSEGESAAEAESDDGAPDATAEADAGDDKSDPTDAGDDKEVPS
jgi:transcription termination/antitermination protein NusA